MMEAEICSLLSLLPLVTDPDWRKEKESLFLSILQDPVVLVVCTVVYVLESLLTYRQGCVLCLCISPALSPLMLWLQCQYLKPMSGKKSFGCLSCHVCAVGVFSHSFSGFLFVAAAVVKLKAYFQHVQDVAFYIGCPEQVLPLCPSPPQPRVLFHG